MMKYYIVQGTSYLREKNKTNSQVIIKKNISQIYPKYTNIIHEKGIPKRHRFWRSILQRFPSQPCSDCDTPVIIVEQMTYTYRDVRRTRGKHAVEGSCLVLYIKRVLVAVSYSNSSGISPFSF